jgi:hypothetical protein
MTKSYLSAQREDDELLHPGEVRNKLKVGDKTLYRYRRDDVLHPVILNSRTYRYRKSEIDRLIQRSESVITPNNPDQLDFHGDAQETKHRGTPRRVATGHRPPALGSELAYAKECMPLAPFLRRSRKRIRQRQDVIEQRR